MKKTIAVLSLLATVILLSGCFDIEQSIVLKNDLSGTASFHLGVDLEPMVMVMAQMSREMQGKTGPMTAEEIAQAKADFKKNAKRSGDEPTREDIAKKLPEGVQLLDYSVKEKDFGVDSDFRFGFDRMSRLVGIKLPSKGDDPAKKNVIDSPFDGLEYVEKGDTITIRSKPFNPEDAVKEQAEGAPKLDPATEEMVRQAFGKMKVVYRITAPFKIVKHNATRREGDTLIWEYNLARFEEMSKSPKPDDGQVQVTYQR